MDRRVFTYECDGYCVIDNYDSFFDDYRFCLLYVYDKKSVIMNIMNINTRRSIPRY